MEESFIEEEGGVADTALEFHPRGKFRGDLGVKDNQYLQTSQSDLLLLGSILEIGKQRGEVVAKRTSSSYLVATLSNLE